jgi:hypothetical protein
LAMQIASGGVGARTPARTRSQHVASQRFCRSRRAYEPQAIRAANVPRHATASTAGLGATRDRSRRRAPCCFIAGHLRRPTGPLAGDQGALSGVGGSLPPV